MTANLNERSRPAECGRLLRSKAVCNVTLREISHRGKPPGLMTKNIPPRPR